MLFVYCSQYLWKHEFIAPKFIRVKEFYMPKAIYVANECCCYMSMLLHEYCCKMNSRQYYAGSHKLKQEISNIPIYLTCN